MALRGGVKALTGAANPNFVLRDDHQRVLKLNDGGMYAKELTKNELDLGRIAERIGQIKIDDTNRRARNLLCETGEVPIECDDDAAHQPCAAQNIMVRKFTQFEELQGEDVIAELCGQKSCDFGR